MEPYTVYLLERFKAGETPEEQARREGIPVDRVRTRLTAAAEFERARLAHARRDLKAKFAA